MTDTLCVNHSEYHRDLSHFDLCLGGVFGKNEQKLL